MSLMFLNVLHRQLFGVDGGRFVHVVGGSTESTVSYALASLLSANNLQSPLLQTGTILPT